MTQSLRPSTGSRGMNRQKARGTRTRHRAVHTAARPLRAQRRGPVPTRRWKPLPRAVPRPVPNPPPRAGLRVCPSAPRGTLAGSRERDAASRRVQRPGVRHTRRSPVRPLKAPLSVSARPRPWEGAAAERQRAAHVPPHRGRPAGPSVHGRAACGLRRLPRPRAPRAPQPGPAGHPPGRGVTERRPAEERPQGGHRERRPSGPAAAAASGQAADGEPPPPPVEELPELRAGLRAAGLRLGTTRPPPHIPGPESHLPPALGTAEAVSCRRDRRPGRGRAQSRSRDWTRDLLRRLAPARALRAASTACA